MQTNTNCQQLVSFKVQVGADFLSFSHQSGEYWVHFSSTGEAYMFEKAFDRLMDKIGKEEWMTMWQRRGSTGYVHIPDTVPETCLREIAQQWLSNRTISYLNDYDPRDDWTVDDENFV